MKKCEWGGRIKTRNFPTCECKDGGRGGGEDIKLTCTIFIYIPGRNRNKKREIKKPVLFEDSVYR